MYGTRSKQSISNNHQAASQDNGRLTCDPGMSKRAVGTFTFTSSDGRITGSAGDFGPFRVGDPVTVYGTNQNNGDREIVAITGDRSWIQVDLPPKAGGPTAGVEVRFS